MRYTIQDPQTGKTVTIEGDRVPSIADREKIFKDAGLRGEIKAETKSNKALDILTGLGKSFISPVMDLAKIKTQKQPALGPTTPLGSLIGVENPIPAKGQTQAEIGTAMTALAVADLPKILSTLYNLPKYLTKGGTNKAIEQGASKGADVSMDVVESEAKKQLAKRYQGIPDVQKAGNEILKGIRNERSLTSPGQLTSPELLGQRRALSSAYGKNIFDYFTGGTAEKKAASEIRNVLSQTLHEYAPGTKIPDWLYSLYSKGGAFGGSPAAVAGKYGGAIIGNSILGNPLGKLYGLLNERNY